MCRASRDRRGRAAPPARRKNWRAVYAVDMEEPDRSRVPGNRGGWVAANRPAMLGAYAQYWRINLLTMLEYRANFIMWFVFAIVYHGVALGALYVTMMHFPSMNGWNFREMFSFFTRSDGRSRAAQYAVLHRRERSRVRTRRPLRPLPCATARYALSGADGAAADRPRFTRSRGCDARAGDLCRGRPRRPRVRAVRSRDRHRWRAHRPRNLASHRNLLVLVHSRRHAALGRYVARARFHALSH